MLSSSQLSTTALLLMWLLFANNVFAVDNTNLDKAVRLTPDLKAGEKTYVLCAACHGDDGFGQQQGEFPSIAGQHQRVILKQMLDVQSKKRINPTMYPFTDLETLGGLQGMANIAAYTAALPANPSPVTGKGDALEKGRILYKTHCVTCHGKDAQGSTEHYYPRLTNQHYPYLVRELGWIRDKVRKNSDPAMVLILQNFVDDDIQAVADYLSRLP
jgi:cytochrome c553